MTRTILGYVGLGATLVFALPVALLGLELLARGRTLPGVGLLVVAALMIAVEELVTTPGDVPAIVARHTIGRVVKSPDEEE